jgi:hypothetical protein
VDDTQNPTEQQEDNEQQEHNLKDLTAQDIIEAKDRVMRRIAVPEWGGAVWVRSMSSGEKEKYIKSVRRTIGKGRNATEEIVLEESSARLAQMTLCDSKGILLFNAGQIKMLSTRSAKAMQRVVDAAAELNGLDEAAEEESKNDSARPEVSEDSSTD